jgi:S4 domain
MQPCKYTIALCLLVASCHGFVLSPPNVLTQSKLAWRALQSKRTAAAASAITEQPPRKPTDPAAKQPVKQPVKKAPLGAAEEITVLGEDHNAPIDWVLSRRMPHHSRRFFRKELVEGHVRIDGRVTKRYNYTASSRIKLLGIEHTHTHNHDGITLASYCLLRHLQTRASASRASAVSFSNSNVFSVADACARRHALKGAL